MAPGDRRIDLGCGPADYLGARRAPDMTSARAWAMYVTHARAAQAGRSTQCAGAGVPLVPLRSGAAVAEAHREGSLLEGTQLP